MTQNRIEQNKQLVRQLYRELLNKNVNCALQLLREDYIEHNPLMPTGRQGFIDHFSGPAAYVLDGQIDIKRVIAEGDYVVVHHHMTTEPGTTGKSAVDIYRMQEGLIAEHWEVVQPIPEQSANDNTMF